MSAKQQGLVWELDIPANQQQVLLALADHAHHDGSNARPSVDLLAWKTGRSERHIRRVLSDLRDSGLIEATQHGSGGRNNPTVYQLHLDKGPKKPDFRTVVNPAIRTGFQAVSGPESASRNPDSSVRDNGDKTLTVESGNGVVNPDRSGTETLTGAVINPDSSVRGTIEPSKNPISKTAKKRAREQDPLFNAIAEAWKGQPYHEKLLTAPQSSLVGMVTAELRAVGATPEEVPAEWQRIRSVFDNPGPRALSAHWKTDISNGKQPERIRTEDVYPRLA